MNSVDQLSEVLGLAVIEQVKKLFADAVDYRNPVLLNRPSGMTPTSGTSLTR